MNPFDFSEERDIAWCPGCGNFPIRKALLDTLQDLQIEREKLVLVSGIGQAAKMPQYINSSFFNGLHGRALPAATAIKAANPNLTVIAEGGDGDMYGEGGNHLLHATRRNPNMTLFVHENMVYGLTKGQAAPTSRRGMETPLQVFGVTARPLNPMALAISMDVTFVARTFSGDIAKTKEIMKRAIQHKGFAIVDIFHPCVSFNKINTLKWFKEKTYWLGDDWDPSSQERSFAKALEEEPFPLGVLYESNHRPTFEDEVPVYRKDPTPLVDRSLNSAALKGLVERYR